MSIFKISARIPSRIPVYFARPEVEECGSAQGLPRPRKRTSLAGKLKANIFKRDMKRNNRRSETEKKELPNPSSRYPPAEPVSLRTNDKFQPSPTKLSEFTATIPRLGTLIFKGSSFVQSFATNHLRPTRPMYTLRERCSWKFQRILRVNFSSKSMQIFFYFSVSGITEE